MHPPLKAGNSAATLHQEQLIGLSQVEVIGKKQGWSKGLWQCIYIVLIKQNTEMSTF